LKFENSTEAKVEISSCKIDSSVRFES